MNKTYLGVLMCMILAFILGGLCFSPFIGRIVMVSEEEYTYKRDLLANEYKAMLEANGHTVLLSSPPEWYYLFELGKVERKWQVFLNFHNLWAPESPFILYNQTIQGGHIPTFYFMYTVEGNAGVIIYRVY